MGNYLFSNSIFDIITNDDYTEEIADIETNTNNKNAYYYLGLTAGDIEVYELMECMDEDDYKI